ncbi:MAG: TldD/PmbA family protein [Crenarchaeota archaeon]|nr:TldD/PmbA family protein [Thermoproteota archaeon]
MIEPRGIRDLVASRFRDLGIDEWVLVVRSRESTMAKFANNAITVVQYWNSTSVEIYAARDSRIAHAQGFVSSADDCLSMANRVAESLSKVEPSPLYAPLPEPSGKPLQGTVDPRIRDRSDDVLSTLPQLIDEALRSGAERVAGTLEFGYEERTVYTSKGFEGTQPRTYLKAYARAFKGENSGHWAWGSTRFDEHRLAEVGHIAGEFASTNLPVANVEPGEYQAILSPLVVGNLVNTMALMSSALLVLMGASMFAKLEPGQRVFSENFTLVDAPLDSSLPNASGFDDEGVACRNKPIVKRGVFKTLLHNSKTAKRMNAALTGNAGLFMPTPWNLVIEAGSDSLDNLIKDVKRGFLVLNNWYTRMQNWIEGMFSTVTRDALIYIENGEPKALCRRLRIADTYRNVFSRVAALTKDTYSVWWWEVDIPTRSPYILIERARFTRPEA